MNLNNKQLLLDFYARCVVLSNNTKQDMMIDLI